jgi:hypothetical protein
MSWEGAHLHEMLRVPYGQARITSAQAHAKQCLHFAQFFPFCAQQLCMGNFPVSCGRQWQNLLLAKTDFLINNASETAVSSDKMRIR